MGEWGRGRGADHNTNIHFFFLIRFARRINSLRRKKREKRKREKEEEEEITENPSDFMTAGKKSSKSSKEESRSLAPDPRQFIPRNR